MPGSGLAGKIRELAGTQKHPLERSNLPLQIYGSAAIIPIPE
jgi:hypothetical protein